MSLNAAQTSAADTKVLIIGAGPAGLFAASELLRHGVRPRIVEQRRAPHRETRGTALQPAVLETLDKGGVLEPFLADSVRIKQIELLGPEMQRIALVELAGLGCKYEFQCSQPQWRTETVLRDHLARQGLQVEFGTEATSIEPERGGVTVTFDKDGRTEVVRADYLVGAGGGHSVTRHSMQERLDGETYGGRYIVADIKLALPCPHGRARVVVGPGGFVLLSPLPEGRFLIFVNRNEADENAEPPAEAELAALLKARIGKDVGLEDLRWVSYFQMHKRIAPILADGRRFLLGDAGHLSSPMGGEGINSALMDGADIAWKLALVLRGAAKPSLLEALRDRTRSRRPPRAGRLQRGASSSSRSLSPCAPTAGRRAFRRSKTPRRRLPACASARCSTSPISEARSLMPEAQLRAGALRIGAVSRAPPIISSCSATRHGSTISAPAGALSWRSSTARRRGSIRPGRDCRRAASFSSVRTVSSASGALPRMRRR